MAPNSGAAAARPDFVRHGLLALSMSAAAARLGFAWRGLLMLSVSAAAARLGFVRRAGNRLLALSVSAAAARPGRAWHGLLVLSMSAALSCASSAPHMPTDAGDSGTADSGWDAGPGDGGPEGLPLAQACGVLNLARCSWYQRCGLVGPDDGAQRECLSGLTSIWCGPATWPARVQRGTLRYDPLMAQACADAFAARGCSAVDTLPEPCNRAWVPNTFTGQPCYDGLSECVEGTCRGASCPRACQLRGLSGEVCDTHDDCRQGLYCRITSVSSGVGQCVPAGTENQLCDVDAPCGVGLTCVGGRCVFPPPVGQPCISSLCDFTGFCASAPDGGGTCVERRDAGVACSDDVQCAQGLLCEQLYGRCVPTRLTSPGEPCRPRQLCPAGTACVGPTSSTPGSCVQPRANGQACSASSECESHLACGARDGGLDQTCGPRLGDGERCALDSDCQLFARCLSGVCRATPNLGGSCANSRACLTGACLTVDAGPLCVESFGPGATCQLHSDCASGRCVTGRCLPGCLP